jgi:hypothetical protein
MELILIIITVIMSGLSVGDLREPQNGPNVYLGL